MKYLRRIALSSSTLSPAGAIFMRPRRCCWRVTGRFTRTFGYFRSQMRLWLVWKAERRLSRCSVRRLEGCLSAVIGSTGHETGHIFPLTHLDPGLDQDQFKETVVSIWLSFLLLLLPLLIDPLHYFEVAIDFKQRKSWSLHLTCGINIIVYCHCIKDKWHSLFSV